MAKGEQKRRLTKSPALVERQPKSTNPLARDTKRCTSENAEKNFEETLIILLITIDNLTIGVYNRHITNERRIEAMTTGQKVAWRGSNGALYLGEVLEVTGRYAVVMATGCSRKFKPCKMMVLVDVLQNQ